MRCRNYAHKLLTLLPEKSGMANDASLVIPQMRPCAPSFCDTEATPIDSNTGSRVNPRGALDIRGVPEFSGRPTRPTDLREMPDQRALPYVRYVYVHLV
jgi:hypothetical protein